MHLLKWLNASVTRIHSYIILNSSANICFYCWFFSPFSPSVYKVQNKVQIKEGHEGTDSIDSFGKCCFGLIEVKTNLKCVESLHSHISVLYKLMSTEIFRWKPQLTSAPLWMRSQPQHPLLLKWECVCDSLALINSYCWVVVVFIMLLSCSSKWTLVSLIFFCVWVFPPTGFIYSTSISKNLPHPKSCSDRVLWWDFISLILNRSMALLIAVMMKLPCYDVCAG